MMACSVQGSWPSSSLRAMGSVVPARGLRDSRAAASSGSAHGGGQVRADLHGDGSGTPALPKLFARMGGRHLSPTDRHRSRGSDEEPLGRANCRLGIDCRRLLAPGHGLRSHGPGLRFPLRRPGSGHRHRHRGLLEGPARCPGNPQIPSRTVRIPLIPGRPRRRCCRPRIGWTGRETRTEDVDQSCWREMNPAIPGTVKATIPWSGA